MNKLVTITIICALTSLTGCASRRDDQDGPSTRRSRGLSISQFGLINVSSGNTITAPGAATRHGSRSISAFVSITKCNANQMDKSFLKTEPVAAPGPALVAGGIEEAPIAPVAPRINLSADLGAPIARQYAVGDTFDGSGAFRVVSIDGDNVELELVDLTPTGGGGAETAEGAVDEYLAGKKAPEEEMM